MPSLTTGGMPTIEWSSVTENRLFSRAHKVRFFFSGLSKLLRQPPNIFPISSSFSARLAYCVCVMSFASHAMWIRYFNESSSRTHSAIWCAFLSRSRKYAMRALSSKSKYLFSMRTPIVYRCPLGICPTTRSQPRYPSLMRSRIEAVPRFIEGGGEKIRLSCFVPEYHSAAKFVRLVAGISPRKTQAQGCRRVFTELSR
jgi:hypothetical protein